MSFYVYVAEDGEQTYPLTLTDLRRMQPNVSFPVEISDEDAASFGFYAVQETPPPEGQFQTVERSALQIDGIWIEQWAVTPWAQDQIALATAAQWQSVRALRNTKLENCDWTQLPDAPVDAAVWAAYRQELRDITNQPDPFNITWPQEPE